MGNFILLLIFLGVAYVLTPQQELDRLIEKEKEEFLKERAENEN